MNNEPPKFAVIKKVEVARRHVVMTAEFKMASLSVTSLVSLLS